MKLKQCRVLNTVLVACMTVAAFFAGVVLVTVAACHTLRELCQ